ncbi:hypothetical protein Q0F98_31215 [Paenibacillus amylolyticus]|nr:hypothetical protein Q0F98_31215 [Paenibacillus amylolyticus]
MQNNFLTIEDVRPKQPSLPGEGYSAEVKLSPDEQRVIYLLEQGEQSLDQLVELLGWDFGHLHSVLLSLIIKSRLANYQALNTRGYDEATTYVVRGNI